MVGGLAKGCTYMLLFYLDGHDTDEFDFNSLCAELF